MSIRKTYVLMILDGWGIGERNEYDAVYMAKTPFLDKLQLEYPNTQLSCSGGSVGLPDGIMGNSEVGHLNIGAGRTVYQDLLRINKSISDNSFYENISLNSAFEKTLLAGSSLHLMGLLSDGGVHSQISHLEALLKLAKKKNLSKVFVHAILDGRDTPPNSGIKYLKQIQSFMNSLGCGSLGSICGRYYAMDRDKRWERVEKAYKLYTEGIGEIATDSIEAVSHAYTSGETDEFVKPIIICNFDGKPKSLIDSRDTIIFFNFRADRAREISQVFTVPEFKHFNRGSFPVVSEYISMTSYDEKFTFPSLFPPLRMKNLMGEVISDNGLKQLRIAETEKYAHVTYFFNGGEETSFLNEDRYIVPSPRSISTYDEKPEMSAWLITEKVLKCVELREYDFIVINFANMDMVGHTGLFDAAVMACETVDQCVEKITNKVLNKGGIAIVTADHGNSEKMMDEEGGPFTSHTTNKVPFIIVSDELKGEHLNTGSLSDIAPTILTMMGIKQPNAMTGKSLFDY